MAEAMSKLVFMFLSLLRPRPTRGERSTSIHRQGARMEMLFNHDIDVCCSLSLIR
jgi:hypothetical protein